MVTMHFMENRMVSARELRKITNQIERVALILRPARLAAGHVERRERAEDVFAAGIVDKSFVGDECTVRGKRSIDGADEPHLSLQIPAAGSVPLDSLGEPRQTRSPRRSG
jgi:hypothetical protein